MLLQSLSPRRLRALVLAVVGAVVFVLVGPLALTTAAAAPAVSMTINGAFQTRAGYTGKGGIFTPSYSVLPCGDDANETIDIREFKTTISKGGKTVATTYAQMKRVRLNPGTYRVQTRLRYVWRGKSTIKTKTSTVKVTRKTDATSVSTGEYKKIKKGMTLAQVRKIIGGKGHYNYGNLQMESLTYEHTVGVSFSKGRVTDKYKYSHVYDWC